MGKRTKPQDNSAAAADAYIQLVKKKEDVKNAFSSFQIDLPDLTLDYENPDQRRVIQEGIAKLVDSYQSTGVQADKQPISVLKRTYAEGQTMPKTLGQKYLKNPTSVSQSRQRYLVVNGQHRIKALMRFDEGGWQNRTWNANCYDEDVVSGIHPQYMAWLCENLEVTQGIATSVTDKVVALRHKGYDFCTGPGLLNYMLANATQENYKTQNALQSRMRVLATFPEKGLMPREDPKCLKQTCSPEEFARLNNLFEKYLKHIGSALMLDYSKTFGVLVLSSYQVAHFSLTQMTDIIRKTKDGGFNTVHKLFEFLPRFLAVGFVACEATLLGKEMSGEEEGQLRAQIKTEIDYLEPKNPCPESFRALFKTIEICYFEQLKGLVADMAEKKLAKSGNFDKQGPAQLHVSNWFRSIAPVPVSTTRNADVTKLKVEYAAEVISEVTVHIGDFFRWAVQDENEDKYPFVFGDVPYFVTDRACDSIGESMKMFAESERTPQKFVEKVLTALKKITKKDAQVILYCSREQQILFGELCKKEDADFRAFDLFVNYGKSTVKSQLNRTYNCTNVLDYAVQLIRGSPSWTTWGCTFDTKTKTSVDIKMMANVFESKDRPASNDQRPFPKDEILNGKFIEYFAKTEEDGLKHPVLDIFAGSGSMIIPAALAGFNLDLVELEQKNVATYQAKVREANMAVAEKADKGDANVKRNRVRQRDFQQAEITQKVLKRKRAQEQDVSAGVGQDVSAGDERSSSSSGSDNESAGPDDPMSAEESRGSERDVSEEESRGAERDVSEEESRGAERDVSAEESRGAERDVSEEEERGGPEESREVESAKQDVSAEKKIDYSNEFTMVYTTSEDEAPKQAPKPPPKPAEKAPKQASIPAPNRPSIQRYSAADKQYLNTQSSSKSSTKSSKKRTKK